MFWPAEKCWLTKENKERPTIRKAYNLLLTTITMQLHKAEPPSEANIFLPIQEIPHILCTLMTVYSAAQITSLFIRQEDCNYAHLRQ